MKAKENVLVFQSCQNKLPQARWFKTTEKDYLIVPGRRRLNQKVGSATLQGLRGRIFQLLVIAGILGVLDLQTNYSNLFLHCHKAYFLYVSLWLHTIFL